MVERDRTAYTRLFEVRVLHHYWLDDGDRHLDQLDAADRERRLLEYDVRGVLRLQPGAATAELIRGVRGVFRTTGLGFLVAVPADAVVPLDAVFEFHASPADAAYADYTAMTLRPMPVVDVVDPAVPEVAIRYKANVPVLSNETGVARGTGASMRRFLSTDYRSGAGDAVEALVVSGSTLRLLIGDPPEPPKVLGPVDSRPVYLHQGDVREITAPAGAVGAPARGIELTPDMPRDVVAVIRIVPRRAGSTAFDIVHADGTPRSPSRVFEVHVRNRWTTRRYRSARTGAVTSTEAEPRPLTHRDTAATRRAPDPSSLEPEFAADDPARVVRLVSTVLV